MTLRLGHLARLAAIIAVALMAIQIGLAWLYITDRAGGDEPGYRFPLPQRVAAMIALVEGSGDLNQALVALNSPDLRVDVVEAEVFELAQPDVTLGILQTRFEGYAEVFGDRPFAIFVDVPETGQTWEMRRRDTTVWTRFPIRILVGLSDGRVLSLETRDDLLTQIYSVPIGWFSGFLGLIASLIVLFAVRRETKPLEHLAKAVERFGKDGIPVGVAPKGAPELRALTTSFNDMQRRISDLLERQTLMLGALGHDLRTYLTRLTLLAEDTPAPVRAPLERNITKIGAMVENSLEFARDGAQGAQGARLEVAGFLRDWVADKDTAQVTLGPCETAVIWMDPTSFERVIENLVDNGLKFGTQVRIDVAATPPTVRVMDNGPGLPEDKLEKVLLPFVTLDDARTLGASGTGLGLAIAKLLAGDAGGTLDLSNRPTGGLCATLVFDEWAARQETGTPVP
ncbi:MAG: ATP-binding protein [Pseudomonadota bacterium]